MTTALSIITKALQKAGVLFKSEPPSADEASDALDSLNDMLASWSNESLLIYERVTESFNLSSGTAQYQIGVGQTFNTAHLIFIAEAHIRLGVTDYPVAIISDEIYQSLPDKLITTSIPYYLNYTNGYPVATINLYPIPSSALTLFLTSQKQLQTLTLSTAISLPPGWERALIYNLAVELAPEYGQKVDEMLYKIANDSKGAIIRSILKVRTMDAKPFGTFGPYNIFRGF